MVLNFLDPPNATSDQLVNAGIMAGLGFFTTLVSITATGISTNPVQSLIAAAAAAGLNFFFSLAIQRGLKKGE